MARTAARRPDVVVVVLDTARAFDVSAVWPEAPPTTPFLDGFARSCLRFPDATSPSPWTLPSHASLFTGLLPSAHGATESTLRLGDGPATLAELLASEGWATAAVSCNDLVAPATGLARGYQRFVEEREALPGLGDSVVESFARRVAPLRRRLETRHRERRHAADHGGRRTNRLVQALLAESDPDRPLHLFVNYLEAHLPYRPTPHLARRFLPDGVTPAEAATVDQSTIDHYAGDRAHGARDWELLRALYRAKILYLDGLLAELFALLQRRRPLDDALVVVTSDHGENIGDHGLMDHQFSLHDTLLRIPLLVRLPGGEGAADRAGELAQLNDVLPTVAAVLGLPVSTPDGVTLTEPVARDHAVAEYQAPHHILDEVRRTRPHVDWSRFDRGLRAIRTPQRKYIAASDGHNELYDIAADPFETVNLFGGHPDEVRLARTLRDWERRRRAAPLTASSPSPEVTERLSALGYIE